MSLLTEIYETLKDKQSEELKINLSENNLELILFPTNSHRIEFIMAFEEDKSFSYISLVGANAFDTFLINNPKYEQYRHYFDSEPLKNLREEIVKMMKEGNLERKNGSYLRSAVSPKPRHNLKPEEMRNTITFFAEIFQDKLKNPNDYQWHLLYDLQNECHA